MSRLTGAGASGLGERLAAAAAKAIEDAGDKSGNHRLTGETNSLLRESNQQLSKLGRSGAPVAAFG